MFFMLHVICLFVLGNWRKYSESKFAVNIVIIFGFFIYTLRVIGSKGLHPVIISFYFYSSGNHLLLAFFCAFGYI